MKNKYKLIAAASFVAALGLCVARLPIGVHAEGDEAAQEIAAEEDVVSVGTWSELVAAAKNGGKIQLTDDITTEYSLVFSKATELYGQGHKITTTAKVGVALQTAEAVVLDKVEINAIGSGSIALQIYGENMGSYDLTIRNGSAIRGNQYGIYDYAQYYGAHGSKLTITDSYLEWISTSGETVANKAQDTASLYAYGIYSLGMTDATVNITGSEITGYRYAISLWYGAEDGKMTIDGSYISGRTAFDSFAKATEEKPLEVVIKDSRLNGINLWGGASEDYANVILDWNSETYHAENNHVVIDNVEFTVYENNTALNGASAGQYAITNRTGDVEGTNNTVDVYGASSYLMSDEYMTAKEGRQTNAFEEDWAMQYMTYAQTGIKVYGGTYSYNPVEFVPDGYDVYKTEDGLFVVDAATTVEDFPAGTVYLKVGETLEIKLGDIAKKYGTLGGGMAMLGEEGVEPAKIVDIQGNVLVAAKAGSTVVNFNLHNLKDEFDQSFVVVVYDTAAADDANDDETIENKNENTLNAVSAKAVGEILDDLSQFANASEAAPVVVTLEDGTKVSVAANTTEIQQALEAGEKIYAKLQLTSAEPVDDALTDDQNALIGLVLKANGTTKVATYDYTIALATDSKFIGYITELPADQKATVTVDVSDVEAEADGYTRRYQVIRLHDGDAAPYVLGSVYDSGAKTVTFESDKFSTFTLTYYDTENPAAADDETVTTTPDTGYFTGSETADAMSNAAAIAVTIGAVVTLLGLVKISKRA